MVAVHLTLSKSTTIRATVHSVTVWTGGRPAKPAPTCTPKLSQSPSTAKTNSSQFTPSLPFSVSFYRTTARNATHCIAVAIQSVRLTVRCSGGSRGAGGHAPPVGGLKIFFASILILLLSRLHTMGRGNTKVAVCRRFLHSNRLVFAAFCCLCACLLYTSDAADE